MLGYRSGSTPNSYPSERLLEYRMHGRDALVFSDLMNLQYVDTAARIGDGPPKIWNDEF